MGVNTLSAAAYIAPGMAFHIVQAFIEMGTHNTTESLQAFTNTHVPAPPWAAVAPVQIPLSSCNKAADVLVDWFGPDDLKCVVGGERWWQIRGMDGIDCEWVTEKKFLDRSKSINGEKLTDTEREILQMEHLETVMLYVHGGAYFWGSINTHRYQIIRYESTYALKADFYLTAPPPGAVHQPVHPSKIVFAGDSAGGGLCLTVLTILRDMGIPQPAGAVLISPWVDMTHSFPSVMQNMATDIIPPHGFIYKPSPTWPIDPHLGEGRARVIPTQTNPPPHPGHADTLQPSEGRLVDQVGERLDKSAERGEDVHTGDLSEGSHVESQAEMFENSEKETPDQPEYNHGRRMSLHSKEQQQRDEPNEPVSAASSGHGQAKSAGQDPNYDAAIDFWEPKPPKVLMDDPNAKPLELRSQIQLYATNEQLTHPLVSPILQGSLGNLCPLYILAGNGEVLRDEIIYMAHKAAHPKEYPAREGILRAGRRQRENAEKFQEPTRVHLQVYDGMCHVLTVFTFTDSAKYAYRSIAQFVRHVTTQSADHLERNPFPELHVPPDEPVSDSEEDDESHSTSQRVTKNDEKTVEDKMPIAISSSGTDRYRQNQEKAKEEDLPRVIMLRERVDIFGKVRPMEATQEIEALHLEPSSVGLIKEAPVRRWLAGQELWDKKYKHAADKVITKRRQCERKAERLLRNALEQGNIHMSDDRPQPQHRPSEASIASRPSGEIVADRRWGPLDLGDEKPAPSAIAGRRDTPEAVALLKKSIYHTAPATHRMVPKLKTSDAIRAAFDPEDHPTKAPQQSVSEQQIHPHGIPIHGLRIWQSLLT
ncbi:hypothetical protein IEO21_00899 [Rhodonia placenta]|uniref:Alpha/beta hydrolase fold-3 domain-containing protein n=1 Tax=Rhodonia placenta TaxID=104341 RepID=A0A8H7PAV6_9APHY|nr:hypothetical protein IEO21_00899 [Postia placenta]